jgi:hypothetical protein
VMSTNAFRTYVEEISDVRYKASKLKRASYASNKQVSNSADITSASKRYILTFQLSHIIYIVLILIGIYYTNLNTLPFFF